MYYLYILKNSQNLIYVGISKNPEYRLKRHNQNDGAKFTKDYKNFELVYKEEYETLKQAREREIQIKKWSRAKKLALIYRNIEILKKLSKSKPPTR